MRTRLFSFLTMLTAAGAIMAGTPKYIFYYIGDGMGMGQVMAAEAYNRTVLGNDDHLLMMQFPVASTLTTYSASSPVTDSAAAGTALSTGYKTNNGMLGMTPDSAEVVSVAKTLFDDGFGVGLVTSVAPDDATPGAFYTHVPKRSMYYEIGKDAAACGYDFIAGSNLRGIKDKKGNPTDLMKYFVENNVAVVRGTDALETIDSRRVVLLNTDSINTGNIGYTIDSIPGGTTKKLDFGRVFCLYSRLSADYLRPVGSQFSNNVGTNVGSKSERYKKCRHKSWHTQNGESNNQAAK